jgi:hypothetical protein
MSSIEKCCSNMITMINEGAIEPFTYSGFRTAQIHVIGTMGQVRHYNELKYCPFCGRLIKLTR